MFTRASREPLACAHEESEPRRLRCESNTLGLRVLFNKIIRNKPRSLSGAVRRLGEPHFELADQGIETRLDELRVVNKL
jgi:hypothetical protein